MAVPSRRTSKGQAMTDRIPPCRSSDDRCGKLVAEVIGGAVALLIAGLIVFRLMFLTGYLILMNL
ncbi:hypothetical protein CH247_14435 [Rhodococcus sp. 06-156-3b]|nr:hypothetical protein CH280_04450 [Rhodococcus sp. 06-156-4C]OZD30521.1 hypothetical protein CH247_14435 [Rhodococcus sp. 06-156-3b]